MLLSQVLDMLLMTVRAEIKLDFWDGKSSRPKGVKLRGFIIGFPEFSGIKLLNLNNIQEKNPGNKLNNQKVSIVSS